MMQGRGRRIFILYFAIRGRGKTKETIQQAAEKQLHSEYITFIVIKQYK